MIEKIRKWVKDKTGVSPIIAIILMVAITVVLAATIYVWVSGMGGGGTTKIALSMRQLSYDSTGYDWVKYEVISVKGSPGWEDVYAKVNGTAATISSSSTTTTSLTGAIDGGDIIYILCTDQCKPGNVVTIYDKDTGDPIWSAEITYKT